MGVSRGRGLGSGSAIWRVDYAMCCKQETRIPHKKRRRHACRTYHATYCLAGALNRPAGFEPLLRSVAHQSPCDPSSSNVTTTFYGPLISCCRTQEAIERTSCSLMDRTANCCPPRRMYLEVIQVLFAVLLEVQHDAGAAALERVGVVFLDRVRVALQRLPLVLRETTKRAAICFGGGGCLLS